MADLGRDVIGIRSTIQDLVSAISVHIHRIDALKADAGVTWPRQNG